RVIEQAHLPPADQRPVHDLRFDLANLFDFDLRRRLFRIRFDQGEVRMGAGFNLSAGTAVSAGVRVARSRSHVAVERLRKTQGRQTLADSAFSIEQIGMSDSVMSNGGFQERLGRLMTDDIVEGHTIKKRVTSWFGERLDEGTAARSPRLHPRGSRPTSSRRA